MSHLILQNCGVRERRCLQNRNYLENDRFPSNFDRDRLHIADVGNSRLGMPRPIASHRWLKTADQGVKSVQAPMPEGGTMELLEGRTGLLDIETN